MSASGSSGQSRRIEELRPVEISPGVIAYRPGSIVNRLVTEGTKSVSQETTASSTQHRGHDTAS
jgi:hypothetical protein